jgi:LSD1 subclass zinc finger protein
LQRKTRKRIEADNVYTPTPTFNGSATTRKSSPNRSTHPTKHLSHPLLCRPPPAGEMMMLVNCSGCRTPLQLPQGAPCIRCAICGAVTHVAAPPAPGPGPGHLADPARGPPPPPAHGRKRAVICGISYRFSRHELKGCINDAKCMRHLLTTRFSFPDDSIIMLTGMIFRFHGDSSVIVRFVIYLPLGLGYDWIGELGKALRLGSLSAC